MWRTVLWRCFSMVVPLLRALQVSSRGLNRRASHTHSLTHTHLPQLRLERTVSAGSLGRIDTPRMLSLPI